jgi:hypothetical protein
MTTFIRFDTNDDYILNTDDFYLEPPKQHTNLPYKPITSKLRFKGDDCFVLFPVQSGVGFFPDTKYNSGQYNFTYKKNEEQAKFNVFMDGLENWLMQRIKSFANNSTIPQRLAVSLQSNENTKPFYKSDRHYLKIKNVVQSQIYDFEGNGLSMYDVIVEPNQLKRGKYMLMIKIKGVLYSGQGEYPSIIQTEIDTIYFKKCEPHPIALVLGNLYEHPQKKSEQTFYADGPSDPQGGQTW